ncbi:hypothetical protein [Burkholderia vietnamiensis]|uniref:hypothetical protein n=1 Tax=Burkholderia vietnamiensis TaxID=60552 RepID=UPI001B9636CD|nr:hypothetical protein [Burkholderia vietnamiensis]MBR8034482.1 hypothetical protein [Burkholderia vietnamiensis]
MKPTPLLDFWQKPAEAGDPVAVLATTFALETDFFEQNCLARFLEVSSVNEDTKSIDDIVADVELHELLQSTRVTVLADRSAPVQRTSLLWDLLSCRVSGGGLLHAKVSVLIWEKATRVILGSANLTAAGYRRQIELGLAADLGPGCLFPPQVLGEIADELESYLTLVPGYDGGAAVFTRAANTLKLFRQRIAQQSEQRRTMRVAFGPTNPMTGPLDVWKEAWSGAQPLKATHLSPFWDSDDRGVLESAAALLTGRPASERAQRVAVVLGPCGQVAFPHALKACVDSVHQLKELDQELRTLHAKCLLLTSKEWVAALVGSSNHTRRGFGLVKNGRHREMNVWLGAPLDSKEGKALLDLISLGKPIPENAEEVEPKDEDEATLPALPACFGLCRVARSADDALWSLHLGVTAATNDMPDKWAVSLAPGGSPILTRAQWEGNGKPPTTVVQLTQATLPICVHVRWDDNETAWAVLADDRHGLPPGPMLSSLRAQHLLDALATGRSLAQVLREELERREVEKKKKTGPTLDPLKRFEIAGSLLRRGRALAASLSAMQRRLERQVLAADTLRAHLAGPLGPEFVAEKVVEAFELDQQTRAEAVFTLAEIALAVGRVDWAYVLEHIDRTEGRTLVSETLERLDALRAQIGEEPADLASYACRAIKEARQCLTA